MKIERAIEILDPAYHKITDAEEIDAACRMGMYALRQTIPCKPRDVHVRGLDGSHTFVAVAAEITCGRCHQVYTVVAPDSCYEYCPYCGQRQVMLRTRRQGK